MSSESELVSVDELKANGWSKTLLGKMTRLIGHPVKMPDGKAYYPRAIIAKNKNHWAVLQRQANIDQGEQNEIAAYRRREESAAKERQELAAKELAKLAVSACLMCDWDEISASQLQSVLDDLDDLDDVEASLRPIQYERLVCQERLAVMAEEDQKREIALKEETRKRVAKSRRDVARRLKVRVAELSEVVVIEYAKENDVVEFDRLRVLVGDYRTLDECINDWQYPRKECEPLLIDGTAYWQGDQMEVLHSKTSAGKAGLSCDGVNPVAYISFRKYRVGVITCDVFPESALKPKRVRTK